MNKYVKNTHPQIHKNKKLLNNCQISYLQLRGSSKSDLSSKFVPIGPIHFSKTIISVCLFEHLFIMFLDFPHYPSSKFLRIGKSLRKTRHPNFRAVQECHISIDSTVSESIGVITLATYSSFSFFQRYSSAICFFTCPPRPPFYVIVW